MQIILRHITQILLLAAAIFPVAIYSQCGSIGINIFDEGDFGSGSANLIANDPGIAPGYIYTTNVPPFDGFYTITNDLGQWNNNFDCWLDTQDNSNDPDGYMMVVNASNTPGLFYEETVDDLCEGTGYVFSADILNLIRTGCDQLDPNVSFLIDGVVQFETGFIDESDTWITYEFEFETDPGQETVTLSLRNNAPGGFGNDLVLDNITFRPCGPEALILPETIANICEDGDPIEIAATVLGEQFDNQQFQWQESFDGGITWVDIPGANGLTIMHTDLSGGSYFYRYILANSFDQLQNPKCRLFSNVKEIFVQPKFIPVNDTICEGTSILFGGEEIEVAGNYVDSLLTSVGCDSIVMLDLFVSPDTGIDPNILPILPQCWDSENGSIQILEIVGGAGPFDISLDGELVEEFSESVLPADGTYNVMITDRFNCQFSQDITLTAPPPLTLEIGDDVTVSLGDEIILTPVTNIPNPSFDINVDGSCNVDCSVVTLTPLNSGTLIVEAIDQNFCSVSDSLQITVNKDRKVFIPNIFCPDCNQNDIFFIQGAEPNISSIQTLEIFDRWGNKLYACNDGLPNDPSCGWDGSFNAVPLDPGVYVYLAEIEFIDGEVVPFAGDLTLIR